MGVGLILSALQLAIVVPHTTRSLLTTSIPLQGRAGQQASCRANLREWETPISYGAELSTRPPEYAYTMRLMASDNSGRRHRCSPRCGGRLSWGMGNRVPFSYPFPLHTSRHNRRGVNSWRICSGGGNNNGSVPVGGAGDAIEDSGDGDGLADLNVLHTEEATCPSDNNRGSSPERSGFVLWVWLSALWSLYGVWLKQSPMLTNSLTSGALALGGDMAAQCFEFQQKGRSGPFRPDARRVLAVTIDSTVISGPVLHVMYGLMEFFIPTSGGGFMPAATHLVLDTFVLDPMFVASFFCMTGLLESRPLKTDVLPTLRRVFWPAVQASWGVSFFFSPLQYVTFRYLPLEFRVLSVNVCDLVWTSVLSYFSHNHQTGGDNIGVAPRDSDSTDEPLALRSRLRKPEADNKRRISNQVVRLVQA